MNPRDVYERYVNGDTISNGDILEAADYFKQLANLLVKVGPIFRLAFLEANQFSINLERIAVARGLTTTKSDEPKSSSVPNVSWKNTLCSDYTRFGSMISFRDHAVTLGYQYFAWSGWIYDTEFCNKVGILSEDLK